MLSASSCSAACSRCGGHCNEVFVGHQSHQSARYAIEHAGSRERQSSFGVIVATGELEVLADVAGIIHQAELAKDSRVKICQFKVKECLGQTKSRGIASS